VRGRGAEGERVKGTLGVEERGKERVRGMVGLDLDSGWGWGWGWGWALVTVVGWGLEREVVGWGWGWV